MLRFNNNITLVYWYPTRQWLNPYYICKHDGYVTIEVYHGTISDLFSATRVRVLTYRGHRMLKRGL